jgi:hypothetical protein
VERGALTRTLSYLASTCTCVHEAADTLDAFRAWLSTRAPRCVRLASGSTAEGVVRFRGLQSLDELRSKIQECEQRADELGRAIIKES